MTTLMERFNSKWRKIDAGCWIWFGAKMSSGYGSINTGKHAKSLSAHRASYQLYNGEIPEGMHVLHRCDVKECVNPNHLFLGTNADNIADSMNKNRRKGVPRNRPTGLTYRQRTAKEKWNWRTVMTKDRVKEAKKLKELGLSYRAIDRTLGIPVGNARRYV